MTEHTSRVGGCETRYVRGVGETVLLLHSVNPGCSGTDQLRHFLGGSDYSLDRDMTPEVFQEYLTNAIVHYGRSGLPSDVSDLRPQLAAAKHPILYVFGADDERWPPVHDGMDIFLNTPAARYYITSNRGHHPRIEAPAEINMLMSAFLSGKMGA